MKDLYRRNHLQPLESNTVKIHNCTSDIPIDNEAAFAILLQKDRKQHYDKVYTTLNKIGRLRYRYKLSTVNDWHIDNGDFVFDPNRPSPDNFEKIVRPDRRFAQISWLNYYTIASFILIVVLFSVFFSTSEQNGDQIASGEGPEIIGKYALGDKTAIREAPQENAPSVGELNQYADINVLKKNKGDGWDILEWNKKPAYIDSSMLAEGSGYEAYVQHCRSPTSTRPAHGKALLNARTGPHSLIIVNPPGYDAVVKLKNPSNEDVLIYYVYGGETLSLDDIPEGLYSFWYATGEAFNPGCGHFLENVRAWREKQTVNFYVRKERNVEYTTSHVLNLKNPLSDAQPIDLRKF